MGFTLPFDRWMRLSLAEELQEALDWGKALQPLGLNTEFIRRVWQTFEHNPRKERWARPLALYVLKRWCEENNVSWTDGRPGGWNARTLGD